MLDYFDSTAADGARPDPEKAIIAASDLFQLHLHCERAVCRRVEGCRGAESQPLPRCAGRLIGRCRMVLHAVRTFLPPRPKRPEREFDAQIECIQTRMAGLMERRLEQMERQAERTAGKGKWK